MVARASHSCQQKQFDQSERCSVRDLGTRVFQFVNSNNNSRIIKIPLINKRNK